MDKLNFPTETVELPSKGLIYPADHPLRSGKVEIKYMTAKEEDILTNQNYINKGTVLDKLLESLIMDKFDVSNIHVGDKNALLIAARVLGYGKDYEFKYKDETYTVDLSKVDNKPFDESLLDSEGHVTFTLPSSENKVKFKFLTDKEEDQIEKEVTSMQKINKRGAGEITTRLKYTIVSVEGNSDKNEIKNFVENYLLASDSRALRTYIKEISPDVDLSFTTNDGEEAIIPITISFFWPDIVL